MPRREELRPYGNNRVARIVALSHGAEGPEDSGNGGGAFIAALGKRHVRFVIGKGQAAMACSFPSHCNRHGEAKLRDRKRQSWNVVDRRLRNYPCAPEREVLHHTGHRRSPTAMYLAK